jgi:hypothetical protein
MGLSRIARAAIDRRRAPASSRQIDVAVRAEIGPPRIEPLLRQREGARKAQADGWYVGGRSLPRYWPQRLARGSLTARPQPGECEACFRRAGFRAGGRSAWERHRGRRSGADEGRIHPVACRPAALCAGLSARRSGAVDAWRERNPLDKRGSNCSPDRTRHIVRLIAYGALFGSRSSSGRAPPGRRRNEFEDARAARAVRYFAGRDSYGTLRRAF